MAGAVEEGSKVAQGVIAGLKDQPLSLALIVLNIVFVAFVAWLAYTINDRTTAQYKVKDDLVEQLVSKVGASMVDLKSDVRDASTRIQANAALASQVNQTLERLGKTIEDHEHRIRALETRQQQ